MGLIGLGVKGRVTCTVRDAKTGRKLRETIYDNIQTRYSKNTIAQWVTGASTSTLIPPSQIQLGNGIGTPADTDTAMFSAIAGTLMTCDTIQVVQTYYAQYSKTYQATDPSGQYTEAGLLDSNGNLWGHVAINQFKSDQQTLTVQWQVYFTYDSSVTSSVMTTYALTTLVKWMTGTPNTSGRTNLVYNSDFETVTGVATVFSDPLTSGTAWTTQAGSFTYAAGGATSGAAGSIITAGNNAWKPLTGSGGQNLALTAQVTCVAPSSLTGLYCVGRVEMWQDSSNRYMAYIDSNSSLFRIYKEVSGTTTSIASVAFTPAASTTYTITLSLDNTGHLTAKLYSGSGTGGTLLQTLTATDTSLTGGFLISVGGDTGVVISAASVSAPMADTWICNGNQNAAITQSDKNNGSNALQLVSTGQGGGGGVGTFYQNTAPLPYGTLCSISFYAKLVSGSATLHCETFGSNGATNFTLSTSWQRYTLTVTPTSYSQLFFWLNGVGTVLIDSIQLEQSKYATPYIRNDSTTGPITQGTINPSAIIPPGGIQLGSGSGTPTLSDTGCFSPVANTMYYCEFLQVNTTTCQASFGHTYKTNDPSGTFTEMAVFDPNGNCWAHSMFSSSATRSGSNYLTAVANLNFTSS